MATTIDTGARGGGPARRCRPRPAEASFAGALRSEFTKIRSVRSTYWTLLALVVVTRGLRRAGQLGRRHHGQSQGPASTRPRGAWAACTSAS